MAETSPPHEGAHSEDDRKKKEKLFVIPEELKPLLDDMPEAQQKAVKAIFIGLSIKRQSFRSPIPPPDHLKGYNDIIPDGADRILTMAERQSDHRMAMETTVTAREQNQSARGQHYGLIIALAFLIGSVFLIYTNHEVSGTILGSIDLVALVSVFVYGKRHQEKEEE